MARFNITYEIVAQESAAEGDVEERGFIGQDLSLREAINLVFETRTSACGGIECVEANQYPVIDPDWITVYHGMEYETGAQESRSIHLPRSVTPSSKMRIARLMSAT